MTLGSARVPVVIVGAGTDLADWLRRGHSTAAIVRPDRTVMRAARDAAELCDVLPKFTVHKGAR